MSAARPGSDTWFKCKADSCQSSTLVTAPGLRAYYLRRSLDVFRDARVNGHSTQSGIPGAHHLGPMTHVGMSSAPGRSG
jgi:hypothetical protein